jgi:hypothetical protein
MVFCRVPERRRELNVEEDGETERELNTFLMAG